MQSEVSSTETAGKLMPWQLEKLQQAAAVGRRKVKVKQQHSPESAEGHAADIA